MGLRVGQPVAGGTAGFPRLVEVRLGPGQGAIEVGDGLSLSSIQAAFDLEHKYTAAPAMLKSFLDVPEPLGRILNLVQ